MYVGTLVKFHDKSLRELKAAGLSKKASEIIKLTKEWKKRLGIDPDTRIQYHFVEDPRILLKMNTDTAEYGSFHLAITQKCFKDSRDKYREMDILHELCHIFVWQYYVRAANGVVDGQHYNYLQEHEETLVSKLELAFYRMKYGPKAKPPPQEYSWGEYEIYKKTDDDPEDKEKFKTKVKQKPKKRIGPKIRK
jgi:hypothetical protein